MRILPTPPELGAAEDRTDTQIIQLLEVRKAEILNAINETPPPSDATETKSFIKLQDHLLDGLPIATIGPPVTLFNPAFSRFRAELGNSQA